MIPRPFLSFSHVTVVAVLVLTLAPTTAHAYLDAGSASMLFQALIGATAAGMLFARRYWTRIKVALRLSERESETEGKTAE